MQTNKLIPEFDLDKFIEVNRYNSYTEPYNYERYKELNPRLTKKMYHYCYHNGKLGWIRCGKRIVMKYENEILEPVWYLDTSDNWGKRYLPWTE
jgi:hypothetical protein